MKYFGRSEKFALLQTQQARGAFREEMRLAKLARFRQEATLQQRLDLFYLDLANRLLRAKYYAFPAYTNEQLAYLVGAPSGTYLSAIMCRTQRPSKDLSLLMSEQLKKLEDEEKMPVLHQSPYPEAE